MATVKHVAVEAHMGERFKIESTIGSDTVFVDQPKTGGGEDAGPTPLEYFFLSLAGCIATIGRVAAKQKRITLRSMDVKVESAGETPPGDLTSQENPDESGRTEKDAAKTPKTEPENEQPAETPAEPSVSPSRLDVASSALPQQRTWSPAPGPAPTQKAQEIQRLQQPRIPLWFGTARRDGITSRTGRSIRRHLSVDRQPPGSCEDCRLYRAIAWRP